MPTTQNWGYCSCFLLPSPSFEIAALGEVWKVREIERDGRGGGGGKRERERTERGENRERERTDRGREHCSTLMHF